MWWCNCIWSRCLGEVHYWNLFSGAATSARWAGKERSATHCCLSLQRSIRLLVKNTEESQYYLFYKIHILFYFSHGKVCMKCCLNAWWGLPLLSEWKFVLALASIAISKPYTLDISMLKSTNEKVNVPFVVVVLCEAISHLISSLGISVKVKFPSTSLSSKIFLPNLHETWFWYSDKHGLFSIKNLSW